MLKNLVTIAHLVLDGHFGNNNALQMTKQCGLHLISKLRCDLALHFIHDGKQKRKGPRKKYGLKIDYRNIPEKYLVEKSTQKGIETRIYQAQMLHHDFAQALNEKGKHKSLRASFSGEAIPFLARRRLPHSTAFHSQ